MTISAGTQLGPFEVIDLLGAGGMGAVYRAYDPRLRRQVAIKVLPPAFSSDPDRLQRFEQEALAVARLTHPNILAVHDIGRHDESPFIVTELLEGETLRAKMQGHRVPISRAVQYAIEIARGLAAAHEHGVVHRDIKPENLFVTHDGRVKILDFGIAKLSTDATGDTSAATLTVDGAGPLGTAGYMSPEQARGARTDHRTDLFSLGVVLYEMVSGVSPFQRDTLPETMAAILREEPPEIPSAASCPPSLHRLLRHCLEKDPAERFQNARDLIFDLEAELDPAVPPVAVGHRRLASSRVMALLMAGALALAAGGGLVIGRRSAPSQPSDSVTGIHRLTDFSGLEEFPAIAPDLKSVAFTARVHGWRQIFVRLVAGGAPLQITNDPLDHDLPRWSRDASSLIYFSPAVPGDIQGTIWEIPALGGAPRRVIDSVGGGDVGPDGRIACFRLADGHIELVTASAGEAGVQVIARFDEPVYYKYPRWSPDSKWVAYQRGDGVRWDIFAIPVGGGPSRQLTHDNRQIHGLTWLPDSTGVIYSSSLGTSIPYLSTQSLWEVRLDGEAPRRVAAADLSYQHPDRRGDGMMVASRLHMQFDLWKYPTDGRAEDNVRLGQRITRQTAQVQTPTIGANDGEIAFLSDSGGHANLWVLNVATGGLRQITSERDPGVALGVPIWSPDGKSIAFVSSRGNTGLAFGIWLVDPDGGNLRNLAARGLGAAWSPDGRWIYYTDAGALYKVPVTGGSPVIVRSGPARNVVGFDGKTLYFMVDRTLTDGRPGFEIHAASPEDAPSRVLALIPVSRAPQWQIINPALSPDGTLLAMPLTDGVTTNIWTLATSTGEWKPVTDFGDRPTFIARRVSWSPDGRSILAAVGEGDADIVVFEMLASTR
jgi:Tol biopolymer transport system component